MTQVATQHPDFQEALPPAGPELPPPQAEPPEEEIVGPWRLVARGFQRHKLAVYSLHVLVLLYLIAIFAEFIAPYDPQHRNLDFLYCPPQIPTWNRNDGLHAAAMKLTIDPITYRKRYVESADEIVHLSLFAKGDDYTLWGLIPMQRHLIGISDPKPGDTFFFLGSDRYGRDMLSRVVAGARISLSIGLVGVAITFLLGMSIGGISGYVGGRLDNVIQRGIEIINSFPHLPLWIALAAVLPPTWSPLRIYFAITVLLSLLGWTGLARVVRGKILSLREEDYAMAARLLGASHTRILTKHLLPRFASHIIVSLSLAVPGMILGETSLSFIGLGLRPPIVSWGVLLQDCLDVQAIRYYPWLLLPVGFIVLTVLAFNFVGDGLRDAADPYGQGR